MKMRIPDVYFCAGDNRRWAQIAIDKGIKYGSQLPNRVHFAIEFADQNWQNPQFDAYMSALEQHRPHMATVLDWERYEQFEDVMNWAEEAARFVEIVVIIPKLHNVMRMIPLRVGKADVRIGVPCGPYSWQRPAIWEYERRECHLLGGSPQQQMKDARYLNAASVDCSQIASMARRFCSFWSPHRVFGAKRRWWVQLSEIGRGDVEDAPYVAFEMSCQTTLQAWQGGL
ncbi:MAG: DUF6610 family protein [Chloroflexota bacterium]|nr:DUF6610 family protein [Chloroflexota bacterium]